MLLKMRKGTFETNSSSVHAIVVDMSNDMDVSRYGFEEPLTIRSGQYDSEHAEYTDPLDKASYIWTAANLFYHGIEEEKLTKMKGQLQAAFEMDNMAFVYDDDDYIGQAADVYVLLEQLLDDEDDILRHLLFGKNSMIITDRDENDWMDDFLEMQGLTLDDYLGYPEEEDFVPHFLVMADNRLVFVKN